MSSAFVGKTSGENTLGPRLTSPGTHCYAECSGCENLYLSTKPNNIRAVYKGDQLGLFNNFNIFMYTYNRLF